MKGTTEVTMRVKKDEQGRQFAEMETNEARQGRPGWPVVYVLFGGLALAIIAGGFVALAVNGGWFLG